MKCALRQAPVAIAPGSVPARCPNVVWFDLAAKGLIFSEEQLRELCGWSPGSAVCSTDVVVAAHALGFTQSYEDCNLGLHDLRDLTRVGLFPIVGIDLRPYGQIGQHAQVVIAVTSRGVTVQDPLLGQFVTKNLVFEQAWRGGEFLTILIE